MESRVISTSEKILTLVKQKGSVSFTELEHSIDDSYNVIFLAIDRLVRENKLSLHREMSEYLLTSSSYQETGALSEIKSH